jgi:heptosyltransferase III
MAASVGDAYHARLAGDGIRKILNAASLAGGHADWKGRFRLRQLLMAGSLASKEKLMAPAAVKRVLVIRMGHIGEVLLLTPALDLLRQLFPHAEISVLVRSGTESMLQNHPLVKVIYIGGKIVSNQQLQVRTKASLWEQVKQMPQVLRLVREIRRRRFDLVVNFSAGDRSAVCSLLSGARERISYAASKTGFRIKDHLYTHTCTPSLNPQHRVLKDAALIHSFAIARKLELAEVALHPGPLVFNPSPTDSIWAKTRWLEIAPEKELRIVVHPGSRVLYKCWAATRWAELINRIATEFHANTVITAGPGAKEIGIAKAVAAGCNTGVHPHFGDLRLGQVAALIREADLFLGVDTAPMHIAAAVGTKVVALFGPSQHQIWAPWGIGHTVLRRPCPCLESPRQQCDETRGMDCLGGLTVEEVWQATKKSLIGALAKRSDTHLR